MDLRASIMAATKQAMKDKAANRLSTLRLISAANQRSRYCGAR
jgi:uncharacterized protein YqeY